MRTGFEPVMEFTSRVSKALRFASLHISQYVFKCGPDRTRTYVTEVGDLQSPAIAAMRLIHYFSTGRETRTPNAEARRLQLRLLPITVYQHFS